MKKFFTLVALLTCFLGAKAEEPVYSIDYSTLNAFTFYVMGYVPEWDDGVMTDYGAAYKYVQIKDDVVADPEATIVQTTGTDKYNRYTTGGGWHQYFIADGIPTEAGSSYIVKALVKADKQVNMNVNMGWGWGDGQSVGTQVEIPESGEFQEVTWEYEGIGGSSCNLVAQPGGSDAKIEWKEVAVYEVTTPITWKTIYENDGTDASTVMVKYFKNYVAATTDGGAIVVESLDPDKTYTEYYNGGNEVKLSNDWDTQFFIALPSKLKSGIKFKLSMNVKATKAANAQFQSHKVLPEAGAVEGQNDYTGTYIGGLNGFDGNGLFGTDWNTFEATGKVGDNQGSICLNLEVLKETNTYYFKDIVISVSEEDYDTYFTDPLKPLKMELEAAIASAEAQNPFAKTEDSWTALTTAISNGNDALESEEESVVTGAKTAIDDAIAGLKLQDGYTKLTKDMYYHWNNATAPTSGSSNADACDYKIGTSTGQPYGHGSVPLLDFADLSTFDNLYIIATGGTPRILMNRDVDEGQWSDTENDSHLIDNTKGDANSWHAKYFSKEETKTTVDLKQLAADKGFAHLHTIKTVGGEVTVSDMLLYRSLTIGEAGKATFGTLYKTAKLNGATVSAVKYVDGKVTLATIEDGIVPAGVGVLVEGEGEILPTFDVEAGSVDSDLKVSNGTVAGDGSSIYVLANGTHGVGFYLLREGVTVPAGKAYLQVAAGSREFIGFANDATAIKSVETVKANGAVYNLAGQQVKNAQKGVFIINGKKVIK